MLTAMFCLTIIITSRAMRDRTLINRLWMLVGVRDAQEGK
jgi:hypothetical protein